MGDWLDKLLGLGATFDWITPIASDLDVVSGRGKRIYLRADASLGGHVKALKKAGLHPRKAFRDGPNWVIIIDK